MTDYALTSASHLKALFLEEQAERTPDHVDVQINQLTDGTLTSSYQEIPHIFENIRRYLRERGVCKTNCLAYECENSLSSALFLLYLLEEEYSFLLLPKPVYMTQDGKQPIPRFCRYRVQTDTLMGDGSAVDLKYPEQFLRLVEHDGWIGNRHQANHASPKLYLRTSGSTGKPKIAVHSHAKIMANARNCVNRLGIRSEDRIAIPVPIYHMYGLGAAFLPGVAVKASIDLQKGANLLRYFQREKEFMPNVTFLTPAFCDTLIRVSKSSMVYKLTVAAGDHLTEDTFTRYDPRFGCLVKLYGSTEMGAIAAASPREPSEVRSQTVGKPMPGVQMSVEERTGELLEVIEDVGELRCHHEYGFEGYVDDNGKSVVQDNQDGWFRTKDYGRIWADGHLEVLGRCDHSVNRDGLLVFCSDVEKAIQSINGIESVVVVPKGESQRGKGIVAYCVVAQATGSTESDIRSACFERLPKRAVPDQIWIVKSLPILPNGKVDRQKLIGMKDEVNSSKSI
jgi:acyl-CoA synthetase (AMP-forming)/AMP-acid ligase II